MKRRRFIKSSLVASSMLPVVGAELEQLNMEKQLNQNNMEAKPLAITMWDFSWLERRWPGAGYEDWDSALDGLLERGYNAIRLDAYPHLVANDPEKEYTLIPVWDQQMWGSPDITRVKVQPNLNTFIAKCRDRGIKIGLSSWYREDADNLRLKITSAKKMAKIWIKTIESIAKDDLLDTILYVDLCNEWPGDLWAPYFKNDPPENTWTYWHTEKSMNYMKESISLVRKAYPDLPYCYSFTMGEPALYAEKDLSFFDLMEHHTWIAQLNNSEYYKEVGYSDGQFNPQAYKNLVANYLKVYNKRPDYWRDGLTKEIDIVSSSCKRANLPLITTECWGIVDFKDWPLLSWDLIKDLGDLGTRTAAASGQWIAIATSNFCGPQFVGMWRDVDYHQKLTDIIKNSPINSELTSRPIMNRL